MNWAGLRPGSGGKAGGGGICEDEDAEEGGACCWDWLGLVCEKICLREIVQINSHPSH